MVADFSEIRSVAGTPVVDSDVDTDSGEFARFLVSQ
jgi:hypothetical protein